MVTVTLASWPALIVCVGGLAVRHVTEVERALCDDPVAAPATPPENRVRARAIPIARTRGRLNKPDAFLLMWLDLSFTVNFRDERKRGKRERLPQRGRSESYSALFRTLNNSTIDQTYLLLLC